MTTSSLALPDRERIALADLLAELGPDAPTLCEGWTTAHLAAHLVVRDRRPDALPGYGLEQLPGGGLVAGWSHRVEDRLRESTAYAEVVGRLRSGPPGWMPFAWPLFSRPFNTAEFAIHHEDVRRAQPGWTPRDLPRADQDRLWGAVRLFTRNAAAQVAGGLRVRRSDAPGAQRWIAGGEPMTTVEGEPLELLLWAAGRRDAARVEVR